MKKWLIFLLIMPALILSSCKSAPPGTLQGTVTIGPITPVQSSTGNPPVSGEVFAIRKILIYNPAGTVLINTVDIQQIGQTDQGSYTIALNPGEYRVDINDNGLDRSSEVPKNISIKSGETMKLDINIDTGIR
ncbi:MAG: hypothetical protein PHE50_07105 [Dehalococcoidales bacterium]|nr:hypothetical protein [Dehalococcoidales bacterium]